MDRGAPDASSGFDRAALDAAHARVAREAVLEGEVPEGSLIGGVDAAYPPGRVVGAAVVMDPAGREVVAEATVTLPVPAPYVPGYLFARELPAMLAAMEAVDHPRWREAVWLVDGHGALHPGGSGVANHVGVASGVRAVGVAKKPLRRPRGLPDLAPGEAYPVSRGGAVVGYALRSTARATRPIWVSPGHRVSPDEALGLVRRLCRFKLPEPIRRADGLAGGVASALREQGPDAQGQPYK